MTGLLLILVNKIKCIKKLLLKDHLEDFLSMDKPRPFYNNDGLESNRDTSASMTRCVAPFEEGYRTTVLQPLPNSKLTPFFLVSFSFDNFSFNHDLNRNSCSVFVPFFIVLTSH